MSRRRTPRGPSEIGEALGPPSEARHAAPDAPALARLERAIIEHTRATDRRIVALSEAVDELRLTLRHDEQPQVRAEILWHERRLAEVEAAAQQQITALSQALSAIRESTTWRATAPLRKLGSALPAERRAALRRLARRTYWLLTPHRRAMRKQWVVWAPQNGQSA
ncbi:MAG: hypothetical protein ACM3JG_15955, partial [Thiohalocapsa sp.]